MFPLRGRRPRHYGKWVEQAPPPDSSQEGRRHYALANAVSRIAITAPDRHGNPANDRYSDDDYEDDDANDGWLAHARALGSKLGKVPARGGAKSGNAGEAAELAPPRLEHYSPSAAFRLHAFILPRWSCSVS
jgi:hypothetical protein